MYPEWLAMEHYRIHVMEDWPDGERKESGLAAAKAALESLERAAPSAASAFVCNICTSRKQRSLVLVYPMRVTSPGEWQRAA